ncbi:hypothetical protein EDC01DRAFT_179335 [Geopyxis carbonaria]|nr:hypothetical protein EDC01DRAFT_179335 [Geopyxis carbonaria]
MAISTWTPEKSERLLAATLAAHPELKPNYRAIAAHFGDGATLNTIDWRFRSVKKMAKEMASAGPGAAAAAGVGVKKPAGVKAVMKASKPAGKVTKAKRKREDGEGAGKKRAKTSAEKAEEAESEDEEDSSDAAAAGEDGDKD